MISKPHQKCCSLVVDLQFSIMSAATATRGAQAGLGPSSTALLACPRAHSRHIVANRRATSAPAASAPVARRPGHRPLRSRVAAAASQQAPIQQQAVYVDIPESQDAAVSALVPRTKPGTIGAPWLCDTRLCCASRPAAQRCSCLAAHGDARGPRACRLARSSSSRACNARRIANRCSSRPTRSRRTSSRCWAAAPRAAAPPRRRKRCAGSSWGS